MIAAKFPSGGEVLAAAYLAAKRAAEPECLFAAATTGGSRLAGIEVRGPTRQPRPRPRHLYEQRDQLVNPAPTSPEARHARVTTGAAAIDRRGFELPVQC